MRSFFPEGKTKTLKLSHSTVRQIFELNSQIGKQARKKVKPKRAAVLDLTGRPNARSLRDAVLSLPRQEQQELAALAWLGSEVFEDFDEALSYAQILKGRELVEFLEIIPAFDELARGIRMLEANAIHLSDPAP